MSKIIRIIIILTTTLFQFACAEDIDPSFLNPIQLALHSPERSDYEKSLDVRRRAEQVLVIVDVKPGMRVADLDAGAGYYTEIFSSLVGNNGKVFFQNGDRYVTNQSKHIDARLKNNRLPNVVRIDSGFRDLKLPENLDIIFISLAFHDVYASQHQESWNADLPSYFKQLRKALSNDGRLIIIDHAAKKGTGSDLVNELHRIDEEFTINTFNTAGFKLLLSSDILRNKNDEQHLSIWDKKVAQKTDKFLLVFGKSLN